MDQILRVRFNRDLTASDWGVIYQYVYASNIDDTSYNWIKIDKSAYHQLVQAVDQIINLEIEQTRVV